MTNGLLGGAVEVFVSLVPGNIPFRGADVALVATVLYICEGNVG